MCRLGSTCIYALLCMYDDLRHTYLRNLSQHHAKIRLVFVLARRFRGLEENVVVMPGLVVPRKLCGAPLKNLNSPPVQPRNARIRLRLRELNHSEAQLQAAALAEEISAHAAASHNPVF